MDFVNNMWSKTGLRKGSQSSQSENPETTAPTTTSEEANPEEVKEGKSIGRVWLV